MTTANDFMELQIYRRRCDPSTGDIEAPLLNEEAKRSTGASDKNFEGSANDEEPSTSFPKWLLRAILAALFVSSAIAMVFLQTSENKDENWSRGVIGPLFVDAGLIICIIAMLVLANDDAKGRASFVAIFFTVSVILGLGMEILRNNPWIVVWNILSFRIGRLAAVRGSKESHSYLSFTFAWIIGVAMGVALALTVLGQK
jgi:hypothetical protein